MLFERIESKGLAHFSYLIGDQNSAVVIDPRRDCEVYVQLAARRGMQITHILETHRNEDYATGSVELAGRTGATVLHSAHSPLSYAYGEPIRDGEELRVGRLKMVALHTPGHTPGHMSYLLHDLTGHLWMVFTGDTLFAGEVGRTDFLGADKLDEMTGLLYDSLFHKLLPLGDGVIVCPAHGAGSVCGSGIIDRPWTTIGVERETNPRLQHADRKAFIENVGQMLKRSPHFRMVEKLNVEGAPLLGSLPQPRPLSAAAWAAKMEGAQVVDTRSSLAFSAAHVPGALSIWEAGLPSFAGWLLDYDRPILLVSESDDVSQEVRYLIRLGFDRVEGFLAGGMLAWHTAGLSSRGVDTVTVQALCHKLDADQSPWILDVRSEEEVARAAIPDAHNIYVGQLPDRLDEVPADRTVYVFCGSGLRAMVAASVLRRAGRKNVVVVLGGLAGWSSVSCPLPDEE